MGLEMKAVSGFPIPGEGSGRVYCVSVCRFQNHTCGGMFSVSLFVCRVDRRVAKPRLGRKPQVP